MKFLSDVTAGDRELQAFLQRMAGYCLTGTTTEQVLFFLWGTGANGTGTFLNTLRGIWGDYAAVAPMDTFVVTRSESHPTDVAGLRGARLVIAQENQSGHQWDEAKIKALTGGDPMSARFMRQDFFTYTPQFKLAISGNHKPSLHSVDEAIRRRMRLPPFNVKIPERDRDPDLPEKLRAEWQGILRWALDGCLEWQRTGLAPPAVVLEATNDYLAG
jgi:putative DNA primase/helicase